MKAVTLVLALFLAAAIADELPLAEPCNEETCKLPECRCSSTDIPGGLAPRDTPQFVMLTFDDGVNVINIETYRRLIYDRVNSNGCPAGTTFYVSHEYTNYQLVNELYNRQFEIALHSISHRTPQTFWAQASYDNLKEEIADQKVQMAHFANIPYDNQSPDREDEEAWFRFILTNFERHYLSTRAPFGFFIHEWYLSAYPAVYRALDRFLDLVNNLNDAFLVNSADVIHWVKNPVPVNEYIKQPCKPFRPTTCPASLCGPIVGEHNQITYWMQLCNVCPNSYPWVGNPLGL